MKRKSIKRLEKMRGQIEELKSFFNQHLNGLVNMIDAEIKYENTTKRKTDRSYQKKA